MYAIVARGKVVLDSFIKLPLLLNNRCLSSIGGTCDPYDIVIVGSSIAGLALSCAIGQSPPLSNKRVLLIGANPPPQTTPTQPYHKRVCSLSLGSVDLLKRLGVWSDIIAVRCKSYKSIHVWDGCSNESISFSPFDSTSFDIPIESIDSLGSHDHHMTDDLPVPGNEIMGYTVENDVIIKSLSDSLLKYNNVEIMSNTSIEGVSYQGNNIPYPLLCISLTNDETINTKLLVGADGVKSHVRHVTGLQSMNWNYNQSAVIATVTLEQGFSDNSITWQRFLPTGPIALLPLSNTHSSLVWSTGSEHAKQLLHMNEQEFVDSVNTALFEELSRNQLVDTANDIVRSVITSVSPALVTTRQYPPSIVGVDPSSRGMYPLSLVHVPNYVKSRVVLIGDATRQMHPLAGLGINLGLGDMACLYDSLITANNNGEEWGFLPRLLLYETTRQRQTIPIMGVVDSLHRLFSTSFVPLSLLRSIGLQLTNAIPPIKEMMYDKAQNT